MSVLNNIKIEDRNTAEALKQIEKVAEDGKNGNYEIYKRQITISDAPKLTEGKRYIDVNSTTGNARIVHKVGSNLFYMELTKMEG